MKFQRFLAAALLPLFLAVACLGQASQEELVKTAITVSLAHKNADIAAGKYGAFGEFSFRVQLPKDKIVSDAGSFASFLEDKQRESKSDGLVIAAFYAYAQAVGIIHVNEGAQGGYLIALTEKGKAFTSNQNWEKASGSLLSSTIHFTTHVVKIDEVKFDENVTQATARVHLRFDVVEQEFKIFAQIVFKGLADDAVVPPMQVTLTHTDKEGWKLVSFGDQKKE